MRSLRILGTWALVLVAVLGCAGRTPAVPGEFQAGIEAARQSRPEAARAAFLEACHKGMSAGCFLAGRPVDFKKLSRLAVLQGLTDSESTQIAVLYHRDRPFRAYLWNLPELRLVPSPREREDTSGDSPWRVRKFTFRGLQAGVTYTLQLVSETGELWDVRTLTSADLAAPEGRIAVASCMDDAYVKEQGPMWRDLLSRKPHYLFLIGDNVYADHKGGLRGVDVGPDGLWERYVETRNRLDLFKAERLVPTLAIWDDHDYGINDGDRTFPHREAAQKTFRAFFAQEPVAGVWEAGPGVAGRLIAYGQQFFFLDDRSFRSPPKGPAAAQTHWGSEQEQWLLRGLTAAKLPAWLINGDQFFGAYHPFESYEGQHPESFRRMMAELKKTRLPMAFLSGDRHLTEIMSIEPAQLGYRTYEVTTSAIHAKTFPGSFKKDPNPRQLVGKDGTFNYLVLKTRAEKGLRFTAAVFGPAGRTLFEKTLHVRGGGAKGPSE